MRIIYHGAAVMRRSFFVKSLEASSISQVYGARNGSRQLSSLLVLSSSSSTSSLSPMWNKSSSGNILMMPTSNNSSFLGRRMFSSDDNSAVQALVDILAREEQEEVETGNTDLPADLADLQATLEKDWRIVVGKDTNDAMVNMFSKTSSSPKIQVSFHCQDTVQEVNEEEQDDEDVMSPVRFTVTITKAGKTLTFACLSDHGEVKIEGVSTCLSTPESIHAAQGALEKTLYQGPEFIELAEDLQDAMSIYLEEECRITSDVATFVAMYADYKEQLSYVQFLKTVQSIVV